MTYVQWFEARRFRQIAFWLLGMIVSLPAYSQTTFVFPSDSVDISRYQTVWECLMASSRVEKSILVESAILLDTMAPKDNPEPKLLPAPVVAVARQCGAQSFRLNTPSKDFRYYVRLYLRAGQDSLASQMARSHLNALTHGDTSARNLFFRELITEFTQSSPARLAIAWEYANTFDSLTNGQFRLSLISGYGSILEAAEEEDDSVRALAAAHRIVALVDELTENERSQQAWVHVRHVAVQAYDVIYGKIWLDSLKHAGTKTYVDLVRLARSKITGERTASALLGGVGEKALPIVADYWFPEKPAHDVPRANTISLVMRFDGSLVGTIHKDKYWKIFTSVRRLKQQFPQLEIILMTKTLGWFGEGLPPEPEKEAELLASWVRDFYKIDAVVAVSKTSFFRLPGMDRRRINQETENEKQYSFGRTVDMRGFPAFLTDSKGTIIMVEEVNNNTEKKFISTLRTLYSQTTQDSH